MNPEASIHRLLRVKKHVDEGYATKMKPPEMPRKGWKLANVEDEKDTNVDHNFVWPMETTERIYFYVKGMRQLLGSAKKRFKVTEPLIQDNKLSLAGAPLSLFMLFDGYEESLTTFENWRTESQQNAENRNNVFILDIWPIAVKDRSPCEITKKSQFCYQLTRSGNDKRFLLAFKDDYTDLTPDGWLAIFSLIRKEASLAADTAVTVGLYFMWYHPLSDSKLFTISRNDYQPIHIAPYLQTAADYFLEHVAVGNIDLAIGWRIQRQFSTSLRNQMKSDLDQNPDKGGFVVGCQLGHIMKALKKREKKGSGALLIFDIFANNGLGADRTVGPTRVVRRQVVRAFKSFFKNIVVVEAMLKKMSPDDLTKNMDPNQIYSKDAETFIVWLEVALGTRVEKFINAGGHFADSIASFRGDKDVIEILHPEFCNPAIVNWETGETIENDDMADAIFGPQNLNRRL